MYTQKLHLIELPRYMFRAAKWVVFDPVILKRPGAAVRNYKMVPLVGNKFRVAGGSFVCDCYHAQAVAVSFPLIAMDVVAGVHFD